MDTAVFLMLVEWVTCFIGIIFIVLFLYDYIKVFKKYKRYKILVIKKKWVKYTFISIILLFIVTWGVSFSLTYQYIDIYSNVKYMILIPYCVCLFVNAFCLLIYIIFSMRMQFVEKRIGIFIKDYINLDSINNPLVKYLANEIPPERCFRLIGKTMFFYVFTIQLSCVLRYVKNILSRYKIVNVCIEKSKNLKEYGTCVRNIEKYGNNPICYDYLLNEELYRDCVSS